jgi:hypothetical protein
LLEGKKISQAAAEKYKVVKSIHTVRAALAAVLESITPGSAATFNGIDWGNPVRLPVKSHFNAKSLANLLCDLRHALRKILPTTVNYNGLSRQLQPPQYA